MNKIQKCTNTVLYEYTNTNTKPLTSSAIGLKVIASSFPSSASPLAAAGADGAGSAW